MKKVAFVSNTTYSLCIFRLGIMRRLRQLGYEIVCIAPADDRTEELKQEGFKFIDLKLDRKGNNPTRDLMLIRDLYKIYRREKLSFVSHYTIKLNIYGSIAAGLTKTKCINTITGLGYVFMEDKFLCKLVKLLYRFAFIFSNKVVFQNSEDLRLFLKNKLVREDKTLVVPGSGVDVNYFFPAKGDRESSRKILFLFAGRFLWDKGIGELVEALRNVRQFYPDVELGLLGKIDVGNPKGILEDIIRSWEKEGLVKYFGDTKDVRPFIAKSNVIVYPSYYREGIPRFLLEAAAMEKPIITTDSVGCREVIEDGKNGFIVKPKDVASLVNAMTRMIELSEQERVKMGQHGRKKVVAEFDENKVIQLYLDVIKGITNLPVTR